MIRRGEFKGHSGKRPPPDDDPVPQEEHPPHSDFEELFQKIYDAAIIADMSGQVLDANARATQLLLRDRAELCAASVFELISGADDSLLSTLCENLVHEPFTILQAHCKRKDDSTFPSEIAVSKLRLKNDALIFFIRDITGRRAMENRLKEEG